MVWRVIRRAATKLTRSGSCPWWVAAAAIRASLIRTPIVPAKLAASIVSLLVPPIADSRSQTKVRGLARKGSHVADVVSGHGPSLPRLHRDPLSERPSPCAPCAHTTRPRG